MILFARSLLGIIGMILFATTAFDAMLGALSMSFALSFMFIGLAFMVYSLTLPTVR